MSQFFRRRLQEVAYALVLTLVAFGGLAHAQGVKAGALMISPPWARATPKGAKVGGGYLSVTNTGTEPDTLTGGSFAQAGHVEIHRMAMEGTVMKMAPVEGGLTIKPGETVMLKPGGYHMMLMDLRAPLAKGATVEGTLVFAKAGTVPVSFHVAAIAAQAPEGVPAAAGMPGMDMQPGQHARP